MREPQPALFLLILEGLALLALLGWWTTRTPLERTTRIVTLLVVEQATTVPPPTLLAQVQWLVQHRLRRLQSWGELSAVAGVIGLVEGAAWRRRHPFGGFGFVRLALGHVLGVGLGGGRGGVPGRAGAPAGGARGRGTGRGGRVDDVSAGGRAAVGALRQGADHDRTHDAAG